MAHGFSHTASAPLSWALYAVPALVVAAMIAATAPVEAQAEEATVRLLPPISSVDATDGPFTVYVVVDGLEHYGRIRYDDNRDTVPDREEPSDGLAAFEVTIEFDQSVVVLDRVEPGPVLDHSSRTFRCLPPQEQPGVFKFGCLSLGSQQSGLQGSFTLARIELQPVGRGSSPLLVDVGLAGPLGDEVPVAVAGGAVRVTGQAPPIPITGGSLSTAVPSLGTPIGTGFSQLSESPSPIATAGRDQNQMLVRDATDIEAETDDTATPGGSSRGRVFWVAGALGGAVLAGSMWLVAILLRHSSVGGTRS